MDNTIRVARCPHCADTFEVPEDWYEIDSFGLKVVQFYSVKKCYRCRQGYAAMPKIIFNMDRFVFDCLKRCKM